jgi:D-aspartate ligase
MVNHPHRNPPLQGAQRDRCVVVGDINLVRALGLAGLRSRVATTKRFTTASLSRFCSGRIPVPNLNCDEAGFVRNLMAYARTCSERPVLFTESDGDTLVASRHREELSTGFHLVLPDAAIVEATIDKLAFTDFSLAKGLPVPTTRILRPGESFTAQADDWNIFPCILKPAMRHRWFASTLASGEGRMQKAIRCENAATLRQIASGAEAHGGAFVLQESIEGGEEWIESYHAYVRPGGEIVGEFTGKKIRTFSRIHGASTCVTITDDPTVATLGREVLARIGFSGVVKLDFKRDVRDGRLRLLEINPRFSLWHYPGAVAGVNLPALAFADALAPGSAKAGRARAGVTWIHLGEDWKAMREYRAAGELSFRSWLGSVLRADTCHEFAWSDPLPGFFNLGNQLARSMTGRRKR